MIIGVATEVTANANVSGGRCGSTPIVCGEELTTPAAPLTPNVTSQSPSAVIGGTSFACPALVIVVRSTVLPPSGAEPPVTVGTAEKVTVVPSGTGDPLSVTATSRNTSPAKVLPVTFRRYGSTRRFGTTVCICWRGGSAIGVTVDWARTTVGSMSPRNMPKLI